MGLGPGVGRAYATTSTRRCHGAYVVAGPSQDFTRSANLVHLCANRSTRLAPPPVARGRPWRRGAATSANSGVPLRLRTMALL